ncbi:MAG: hypothetical protein AAGJ10_06615 [Bacteroidota bacterium]
MTPRLRHIALLLIALTGAAAPALGQDAWTVDPQAFEAQMQVTAVVMRDGVAATHPEATVAAFAGTEVRGVAQIETLGSFSRALLTVYGAPTETTALTFRYADPLAGDTLTLATTLAFESGAAFGTLEQPFGLLAASPSGTAPSWAVSAASHELTVSVTAHVFTENGPSANPSSRLAAFVGDAVRGVASPTSLNGQSLFLLTVHGAAGETVAFRHYDATTGETLDLAETTTVAAGAALGTLEAPFSLTLGARFADPAWTFTSAAAHPARTSAVAVAYTSAGRVTHPASRLAAFVGTELRGVAALRWYAGAPVFLLDAHGTAGEAIRYAVYDGAEDVVYDLAGTTTLTDGTVQGSLTQPHVLMAQTAGTAPTWSVNPAGFPNQMTVAGTLTLGGTPATHPGDRLVAFSNGTVRGVAAPTMLADRAVFLMTVYGTTQTPPDTLTFQTYSAAHDATLALPDTLVFAAGATVGSLPSPYAFDAPQPPPAWVVGDPADYDGTMTVTGTFGDNLPVDPAPGDRVAAFSGDEVRGVTTLTASAGKRGTVDDFTMTILGNTSDQLRFSVFSAETGQVLVVNETVPFEQGVHLGQSGDVEINTARPLQLDLRVFLEGAYTSNGQMRTALASANLVPLTQPYGDAAYEGTPSRHTGAETVAALPAGMVDWVLVELRTGTGAGTLVRKQAAVLLSDGRIVHTDGVTPIRFHDLAEAAYYVVVRHRNHLPVMSAVPLALSTEARSYNFSAASQRAFGVNAQQKQASGVFMMYAGDADASGGVTATDVRAWRLVNGIAGAFLADFNLSGGVTAADRLYWRLSNGIGSQVPE